MISYKQAKEILLKAGEEHLLKTEELSLERCVGRVCVNDIFAPMDIQPFDNSAMDGFALRLEDLDENGGTLIKSGLIAAGDKVLDNKILSGHCIEIMTGAPIPENTDAVVPIELTQIDGDRIIFKKRPNDGANIRRAGEDFKKGTKVLKASQIINPQHIMPIAALGIDKIKVYKKPRAAFLATGNELVDDLSKELKSGQIYNSNHPYGLATLKTMGVDYVHTPNSVPDNPDDFEKLIKSYIDDDIDIIISSGAVSAGKFDFIREVLEKTGARILFHKVKIKPGKPNLFARLPNGALYFGLPGNPVATAAGLRFFVYPALRAMMGISEEKPVQATLMTSFKKRKGVKMFLKAKAENWEDGILTVDILDAQASFMVSPFLNMNCWAVAPEDIEEIKPGDIVDLYPLYPHCGLL